MDLPVINSKSKTSVPEAIFNQTVNKELITQLVNSFVSNSHQGTKAQKNRSDVRKFLPDILGRVLARIWIDSKFKEEFEQDPQKTLEFNGVYLPEDMSIEFQKPNSDRPRIVVYEPVSYTHLTLPTKRIV